MVKLLDIGIPIFGIMLAGIITLISNKLDRKFNMPNWLNMSLGAFQVIAWIGAGLFVLYPFRPLWHGFVMHVLILLPSLWIGILVLIAGILITRGGVKSYRRSSWISILIGVVIVLYGLNLVIVGGLFGHSFNNARLRNELVQNDAIQELVALPPMGEGLRMIPVDVAEHWFDALRVGPEYNIRDNDMAFMVQDGQLHLASPLLPPQRGLYNGGGIASISLTEQYPEAVAHRCDLEVAHGIYTSDGVKWQVIKNDYNAIYDSPRYYIDDGKVWTLVPKTKIRYAIYICYIVAVPYYDGVVLIGPDGNQKHYGVDELDQLPDEAQKQMLFPNAFAYRIADSLGYVHGVWNTGAFGVHRDQVGAEWWPYTFMLGEENEPYFLISLIPMSGQWDKDSMAGLMLFNKRGEMYVHYFSQDEQVIRYKVTPSYIEAMPQFINANWEEVGISAVGGLPIFRNNELWWMIQIMRGNAYDVLLYGLVKASDPAGEGSVLIANYEQAREFALGEEIEGLDSQSLKKVFGLKDD